MNGFLFYAAAFALILGVLVFVHEFGHYFVARLFGVKVLRFSVGFGVTLWSRRFGVDQTEWAIGAFPLGGYVKMLDEREGEVRPEELYRSFNRQTVWRRMAIVAAGPLTNLLLAVIVYWGLFWHGMEELKPILGTPAVASAAAAAGIENGEQVLKVDGESVQTWQEMRWFLLRRAVEQDSVELEVINSRKEIAFRRLDVSSARADGWKGDALEKLGIRFFRPDVKPIMGAVSSGSAAAVAGLRLGDEVLQIDGKLVDSWFDFVHIVRDSPRKPLRFEILRGAQRLTVEVTPTAFEEGGKTLGRIGVSVKEQGLSTSKLMVIVHYDPASALGKAIRETWDQSVFSLVMIGKMISGEVSLRNLSGPVTIADYAGKSAKLGWDYYLKFLALVSVSLAVLNLLPVPILDGGHLLYYVVEIINRKPLSERSMEIGQQIGLALLLMLMAFALYNDIDRLISG